MPSVRTIQDGAAWIASQQGKHFCDCGCGQPIEIKIHHHTKGIPRFILNHRIPGVERGPNGVVGTIPSDAPPEFTCGHPRTIENAYFTKSNTGYRCRICAKGKAAPRAKTERNRAIKRVQANRYNRKLRAEMISAYGGCCTCCSEAEPRFLTMEHINGGGNDERKKYDGHGRNTGSAGVRIAARLRREGWPIGIYTILCWNCNMARNFEGTCPHQKQL